MQAHETMHHHRSEIKSIEDVRPETEYSVLAHDALDSLLFAKFCFALLCSLRFARLLSCNAKATLP